MCQIPLAHNNQLVLNWTNAEFSLQSARAVTGPFANIPAATSPNTNPLAAPQQFFRLISNWARSTRVPHVIFGIAPKTFRSTSNDLSGDAPGAVGATPTAATGTVALPSPFANIPAAMSPYTNALTAPRQFFRLISN